MTLPAYINPLEINLYDITPSLHYTPGYYFSDITLYITPLDIISMTLPPYINLLDIISLTWLPCINLMDIISMTLPLKLPQPPDTICMKLPPTLTS